MRYEVASRHRKGFMQQYLVVPADNPDDACAAAYETWDMEDRVITRIRKLDASECLNEKTEHRLLNMTIAFTTLAVCGLLLIVFLG
jgi:hypothetical protein